MMIFSSLLGILAIASVAVLVGGRMADQTRRVGLLKAVGGTPGLVAAGLLAEYVVIALVASFTGLLIGWAAAPLITRPGAGMLGTGASPGLTAGTIAVVMTVALLIALLGTFIPAVRAARISTIPALAASVRPPRRRALLTALSAQLPVVMLLALRTAGRRARRAALNVTSIAITAGGIIAVLGVAGTGRVSFLALGGGSGLANPIAEQNGQVLLVVTVMLGIPLGIGLSAALQHGTTVAYPPVTGILAVLAGTVIAVTALTTPAAHASNHHPIAQALQDETT